MRTLAFRVCGLPKAQPRVKAFRRGNHAGVFDPGTADGWKLLVRHEAAKVWDGWKFDVPVQVCIGFYMPRPKSHFTTKGIRPNAPTWHTAKPDLDNLEKAILDALTNLGVWTDDSLVVSVEKAKLYSNEPGAVVFVTDSILTWPWLETHRENRSIVGGGM